VSCTPTGDCEFVSDTVGTFTITYTLKDAVDQTATGTFEILVKGKPFAPGVPAIVSVGNNLVNLTWTAADMQGGAFVTYHVTAIEAGITKQFTTTGGTFDGLQNATTYRFTVTAENELGMGEPSGPSSGAIPDRVPDPPEALLFTDYADRQLSVKWSPPATAGEFSTITAYQVRIGGQVLTVDDGSTTSLVIGLNGNGDPLSNGTDYSFEVRAQNSATTNGGWGAWSSRSPGTERPSRYPNPPTPVRAVNAGDGGTPRITVTWNAPVDDGGAGGRPVPGVPGAGQRLPDRQRGKHPGDVRPAAEPDHHVQGGGCQHRQEPQQLRPQCAVERGDQRGEPRHPGHSECRVGRQAVGCHGDHCEQLGLHQRDGRVLTQRWCVVAAERHVHRSDERHLVHDHRPGLPGRQLRHPRTGVPQREQRPVQPDPLRTPPRAVHLGNRRDHHHLELEHQPG
jgi:hypothetical protein